MLRVVFDHSGTLMQRLPTKAQGLGHFTASIGPTPARLPCTVPAHWIPCGWEVPERPTVKGFCALVPHVVDVAGAQCMSVVVS